MSAERVVFVGVGAGAATFKAVALASKLRQAGLKVRVLMTPGALEYVKPLSFEAVTGIAPVTTVHSIEDDGIATHLKSAEAAAFVVLPATASLIGALAHGLAGDPVSLAALSACDRRYFCPAMNDRMWKNPIVQNNIATLETHGWTRIGPETGMLAEGYEAIGRMCEPEAIAERILGSLE